MGPSASYCYQFNYTYIYKLFSSWKTHCSASPNSKCGNNWVFHPWQWGLWSVLPANKLQVRTTRFHEEWGHFWDTGLCLDLKGLIGLIELSSVFVFVFIKMSLSFLFVCYFLLLFNSDKMNKETEFKQNKKFGQCVLPEYPWNKEPKKKKLL